MTNWTGAAELARRQHGIVARRQLIELGIAGASIGPHAERAGWRRVHRGVYALPGATMTFEQQVMAAVLAAGEEALASHLTAAFLHGFLPVRPPVVDVLLPFSCKARHVDGVHVTRSRTLRAADRCLVGGVPATTPARTVIDAATVLEPLDIRALLIDGRQQRKLDLGRVARRVAEVGPVRHSGQLRRLLDELDQARVDSLLEAEVRRLLRRAGLPPPSRGPYRVRLRDRTVELDIAWPGLKVAVEVDGFGYHAARRAMDNDHRKQNALLVEGWRILRVTWDRIARDPEGFVAEVSALLTAAV